MWFPSASAAKRWARKVAKLTGRPVVILPASSRRRNPGEHWITLRGRRVEIDDKGRIVRGLARGLEGVPLKKLPAYWRKRRRMERPGACDVRGQRRILTYPSAKAAYKWILGANPALLDLLASEKSGAYGAELAQERRERGRLGQTAHAGNLGAIDDLAAYLNTTPAKLGTLGNAIYRVIQSTGGRPRARRQTHGKAERELIRRQRAEKARVQNPGGGGRWADLALVFRNVLAPAIESQAGWESFGQQQLLPPEPMIEALAALEAGDRCRATIADAVADLGARYRPRVRSRRPALEAAPF